MIKAEELSSLYRIKGLTSAEFISLEDITRTLANYKQAITTIRQLLSQNASPQYIDQQVKINDTTAFIIAAILLMRNRLMNPIKELIHAMKTLAEGNFNIKIFATDRDNEIDEMARALEIFSANALKYRDSEA